MSEELHHEHTNEGPVATGAEGLAGIVLTPKAIEAARKLHQKEGLPAEQGLRVSVVGGGCSGFQYSLNFDALKDGDSVTEFDGFRVYIDEISLPYIAGTTLDYIEGLHGAGFKFDNPRASRVCGCGSSFSA